MTRLSVTAVFLFLALFFQLVVHDPAVAVQKGEPAPDFELSDLNGKTHRLADYKGKVVVINFWASWCPECILEMPSLNTLYEKNRTSGLVVLGITSDRNRETVLGVLKKTPVSYPVLLEGSGGGVFIRKYTVIGLPTTVIIDRKGFIAERIAGRTDFGTAAFSGRIQALLHSGGQP